MNEPDNPDRSILAAEYVLGLLEGDDLVSFEQQLLVDAELAREVGFWQDRLLGLTAKVTPLQADPALWRRIETALPPVQQATVSQRADRPRSSQADHAPGFWDRLAVWRGLTAAAVAVAVISTATLALREPEVLVYYAVLNAPDDRPGWLVQARANGNFRMIPLDTAASVPQGKSWELWTKADGAAGPTSLGRINAGQPVEFSVERLPTLGSNQLFEITVEPPDGSPIGRPTGPVVYIGRTDRI